MQLLKHAGQGKLALLHGITSIPNLATSPANCFHLCPTGYQSLLRWSLWIHFCPLLARGQVFQKLVACINYSAHILHLIVMLSFASICFFANVPFPSHFCASPRRSYQTSMLKIHPQASLMHIWLMKTYSLYKLQFGMPPLPNS